MSTIATDLHELETLRATLDLIEALTDNPPDTTPRDAIVTIIHTAVTDAKKRFPRTERAGWATRSES